MVGGMCAKMETSWRLDFAFRTRRQGGADEGVLLLYVEESDDEVNEVYGREGGPPR